MSDSKHPSPDSLPEPRCPRYETLTAWRGLACLFVVIYHSLFSGYGLEFPAGPGPMAGVLDVARRLWIGVPLFFVISGYCVTASADEIRRHSRPGVEYFWRRFRRIYPPYWVWLAITVLIVWAVESMHRGFFEKVFIPPPGTLTKWQWFGNITLTETWRWHFTSGLENEMLAPSWTLCYEEQFYVVVGLALILARRFFFSALGLVTVVTVMGFFLFPWLGMNTLGLFLDGKWLMFAAGVLVYHARNYASPRLAGWYCVALGIGSLCALADPGRLLLPRVNEPNQSYFWAFLFALLLMGVGRRDERIARAKMLRPLVFCGEMCYSLYLTHWPVVTLAGWAFNRLALQNPVAILLLGVPFCLAVALILARLFHRTIERRFWNRGGQKIPGQVKPPLPTVASPACCQRMG